MPIDPPAPRPDLEGMRLWIRKHPVSSVPISPQSVESWLAYIERLEAAHLKYGDHYFTCSSLNGYECDCGFDSLDEEIRRGRRKG